MAKKVAAAILVVEVEEEARAAAAAAAGKSPKTLCLGSIFHSSERATKRPALSIERVASELFRSFVRSFVRSFPFLPFLRSFHIISRFLASASAAAAAAPIATATRTAAAAATAE
jgi:hypothetical protein